MPSYRAFLACVLLSCGAQFAVISLAGAGTVTQVSCSFELDFCSLTNDASADFQWLRYTGKTPTYDTGPSKDHTTGTGFYVYLESSAPQVPADRCRLLTPPLAAGSYSIGFWYSAWGRDVGTLALLARDTRSGRERLLWLYKPELNGSKADGSWTEVALSGVDMPEVSSQLVWEGIRGVGTYGDVGLDDVMVTRVGEAKPLANGKPEGALALPYECTFEEDGGCGMANSWQSTGGFTWLIRTGPAPSVNTGPSADHTLRNVSGHFLLLDVASREQFEVAAESTPALYSTCGCVELSFWWHGYGSQLGSLTVTLDGFEDQPLFSTGIGDSYNRWRQANVTLQPPTDRTFSILFQGEVGGGSLGDYAIDDIKVQECTYCFFLTTQATTDSVSISTGELTFRSSNTDPSPDPHLTETMTSPDVSMNPTTADVDLTTYEQVISTLSLTSTQKPVSPIDTSTSSVQSTTVNLASTSELTSRVSASTQDISSLPQKTAFTLLSQTQPIPTLTPSSHHSLTNSPVVFPTTLLTSTSASHSLTQQPPTSVPATTYLSTSVSTQKPSAITSQQVITTMEALTTTKTLTTLTTPSQPALTTHYTTQPSTSMGSPTRLSEPASTTVYTTVQNSDTSISQQPLTATSALSTSTTQDPLATSSQQAMTSPVSTTLSTIRDSQTTDNQQSLTTTRGVATITTQTQTSSGRVLPTGQFFCDFESPEGCQMLSGTSTGTAVWRLTKAADRLTASSGTASEGGYPSTDHTFSDVNLGTYMAVHVANESSGSVSLVSANAFNPDGCNRLDLWVYAAGPEVGSLRVALSDKSAGDAGAVQYLWLTSGQNLSSWTRVVSQFKAAGPFSVSLTAKGSSSTWTTFALDDVRLSAINCSLMVDVPNAGGAASTGVNGKLYVTGSSGIIQSANFPNAYPDGYSQKWNITVAGDSRIAFTLALMDTEACCDILQVFDTPSAPGAPAAQLMRASGVLVGEPQTYYSSGSTILVSFAADWDVSLTGFRLQWWAVKQPTSPAATTTAAATTRVATFGQFSCSFDVGWCGAFSSTSVGYGWTLTNQPASNYPLAGPSNDHTTGFGTYVYANSRSPGNSSFARLLTTTVYAADGCNVLTFFYQASGPTLGSLTVYLVGSDATSPNSSATTATTVLWYTSGQATNGWVQAVAPFRYSGTFRLAFEAKRMNGSSLGDYALDDIAVSTCAGLVGPGIVTTANPYADNGNTTNVFGDYGTLRSPSYPLDYPHSYQHTWKITVPSSKKIAVFVNDFLTEACCDVVQLIDGGTGRLVQTLQGTVSGPATYYSDTSNLTIIFVTDNSVQMKGWQLTWWAVAALDTQPLTAEISSASPAMTNATITYRTTSESTIETTAIKTGQTSTATIAESTTTTAGTIEILTTEAYNDGSGASAQTGSSSTANWVYFIIAIAIVLAVCTVVLSIYLWHKRNKNKVGTSTERLRDGDELEEGNAGSESGGTPKNAPIVRDQEIQVSNEARDHRDQPPIRWPYMARGNELYDRIDSNYAQINYTPPSSNSDGWKQRNIIFNPLHPRRQQLYLGEDGQPHKATSGDIPKRHKTRRRHKHGGSSGASSGSTIPTLLQRVVSKAASSLGSSRSSKRISPAAVVPEGMPTIISMPGGGNRPPKPEVVYLSIGKRQSDNPPTSSIA